MNNLMYITTKEEFEKEIKAGTVLVDFYAEWCGPCKMISPILDELAKENPQVKVIKVDVDAAQELAMEYQIMSIPTIMVYKDGEKVAHELGALAKERLEDLIK